MSKLFGYLSYRDVEVAITWLETLGFETTTRQQDDGGATVHAELRQGDAVVMVAPADESYEAPKLVGRSTGHGLYLLVDDVAALHGAVLKAGGSSLFAPEKTEGSPEVGGRVGLGLGRCRHSRPPIGWLEGLDRRGTQSQARPGRPRRLNLLSM